MNDKVQEALLVTIYKYMCPVCKCKFDESDCEIDVAGTYCPMCGLRLELPIYPSDEGNDEHVRCPECGTCMLFQSVPQVQEYPRAGVWAGYTYFECPKCGYESDSINRPIDDGKIQENHRGW